jgi:hypothetical protein
MYRGYNPSNFALEVSHAHHDSVATIGRSNSWYPYFPDAEFVELRCRGISHYRWRPWAYAVTKACDVVGWSAIRILQVTGVARTMSTGGAGRKVYAWGSHRRDDTCSCTTS